MCSIVFTSASPFPKPSAQAVYLKDSVKPLQLARPPHRNFPERSSPVERAMKAGGSPFPEEGLLYVMLRKEEKAVSRS